MVFVSPLIVLPLVNRFAMRKLTPNFVSKQWHAIKLSNNDLISAEKTKIALEELSKKLKIDFKPIIDKVGGDYDKLRAKISTAKNIVLGSDLMLIAGSFGHIGFFNNWQTRKRQGKTVILPSLKWLIKKLLKKEPKNLKEMKK